MLKHRHKSHTMLKPFPDISFTRHSDTVLERKKTCITPCKIMTDNQNKNKTTMKDVQLQHFLFKTGSRMPEMFPKTLFFFVFFCSFFFNRRTSLEARLSAYILTFYLQLLQLVETGYPIRSFSFHLQSENCTTVESSGVR